MSDCGLLVVSRKPCRGRGPVPPWSHARVASAPGPTMPTATSRRPCESSVFMACVGQYGPATRTTGSAVAAQLVGIFGSGGLVAIARANGAKASLLYCLSVPPFHREVWLLLLLLLLLLLCVRVCVCGCVCAFVVVVVVAVVGDVDDVDDAVVVVVVGAVDIVGVVVVGWVLVACVRLFVVCLCCLLIVVCCWMHILQLQRRALAHPCRGKIPKEPQPLRRGSRRKNGRRPRGPPRGTSTGGVARRPHGRAAAGAVRAGLITPQYHRKKPANTAGVRPSASAPRALVWSTGGLAWSRSPVSMALETTLLAREAEQSKLLRRLSAPTR